MKLLLYYSTILLEKKKCLIVQLLECYKGCSELSIG